MDRNNQKKVLLDTLDIYENIQDSGSAYKIHEFLYNLKQLGFAGETYHLKYAKGTMNSIELGELSEVYSFLQDLKHKLNISDIQRGVVDGVIFINHADTDGILANTIKRFIHEVVRDVKLTVFCSSDRSSIEHDINFNDIIIDNLNRTQLGISIFSKEYMQSNYSLMELGYLRFTNGITTSIVTIDDYGDTISLLPPVAHNQTMYLKHSDKSSINSYLGSLINHLISVFDVDIDLDRDNIVDEYASDILNIITSDRKDGD